MQIGGEAGRHFSFACRAGIDEKIHVVIKIIVLKAGGGGENFLAVSGVVGIEGGNVAEGERGGGEL